MLCPKRFNLLQKLLNNPRTILRGIPPQHRTEHLDGFFALPIVRPRADVADMRAELIDDLLDVLKLLWGEVGVIEQPVKFSSPFLCLARMRSTALSTVL